MKCTRIAVKTNRRYAIESGRRRETDQRILQLDIVLVANMTVDLQITTLVPSTTDAVLDQASH